MLDLAQTEVAAGTGLTQSTISEIHNFRTVDLKLSTLRALADFFGCAIDDLFPRVSHETSSADQPVLPFKKAAMAR